MAKNPREIFNVDAMISHQAMPDSKFNFSNNMQPMSE